MQSRALDAIRWMPVLTELAFFTVIDGEQNEIADFEVLILDFGADGADGSRTFVPKDGRVGADFDFALLEDEVLI